MDIVGGLLDALYNCVYWVINLLPDSPFQIIDKTPIEQYLPWINWFVPLNFAVSTLTIWLVAVGVYYTYSIILRWLKAVE